MITVDQYAHFKLSEQNIEQMLEKLSAEPIPAALDKKEEYVHERSVIYRMILSSIIAVPFSDEEALALWKKIEIHKELLDYQMQRNAGYRVAIIDYLSNIEKKLDNPIIVESREYGKLISESKIDFKTGIYNSRSLYRIIDKEINRSKRFGFVFSLLLFDLDNFKQFNDYYGHLEGDALLSRLAKTLKMNLRAIDTPARFGGDEFGILFPQTDKNKALIIADRIRKLINDVVAEGYKADFTVTLSGGLVMYPSNGIKTIDLLSEADKMLYEAKTDGKNRILAFHEKRDFPRFPCMLPIKFTIDKNKKYFDGRVLNISKMGMLIEAMEPVITAASRGKYVMIVYKENNKDNCARARIVRKNSDNHCQIFGCYFMQENPFYNTVFGNGIN